MKDKRGFTLVELIIVIAILAVIMLIGTAAYSSIQERMKVRADKATAGQIGKAIKIRETDVGEENGIGLYPKVIEYDSIDGIENYIAKEIKPQSMEDGNFVATAFQTQTGKKIVVGIGKKAEGSEEYSIGDKVYNGKDESGWAWSEDVAIDEFLKDENVSDSIVVGNIPEVYSRINVGDIVDFYFGYLVFDDFLTISDVDYKIADVCLWKVNSNNKGQLDLLPMDDDEYGRAYTLTDVKALSELEDETVSQLNGWFQSSIFATSASKYVDKATVYGFKDERGYRYIYPSILLKQNIDIHSKTSDNGFYDWYVARDAITGFLPPPLKE